MVLWYHEGTLGNHWQEQQERRLELPCEGGTITWALWCRLCGTRSVVVCAVRLLVEGGVCLFDKYLHHTEVWSR